MDPLPAPLTFFLLLFSGWINRHQQAVIDYLLEENRALRAVNGARRPRLTHDQRRRLAVKGHVLGDRHLVGVAGIVTPDTILRWYRRLVAKKYNGSPTRRPGRPTTKPDIAAVVVRKANENPTWGYTRIRGGLKHLGHDVARNTIKAILKDHGIEPAPERRTKMPWTSPTMERCPFAGTRRPSSAPCNSTTKEPPSNGPFASPLRPRSSASP